MDAQVLVDPVSISVHRADDGWRYELHYQVLSIEGRQRFSTASEACRAAVDVSLSVGSFDLGGF